MLYQTQFCHPSVILRASVTGQLPVLFEPAYVHAEDYELFSRLAYTRKVSNIPEVLLKYRLHASSVSSLYKTTQIENSQKIMVSNFKALGIAAATNEVILFEKLAYQNYNELIGQLNIIENLLTKMMAASPANTAISHPFLFHYATQAWFNTCYNLIGKVNNISEVFFKSEITKNYVKLSDKLRFKIRLFIA